MSESAAYGYRLTIERDEHERRDRQHASAGVEPTPVSEVRGEERQHEQTDVRQKPPRFLFGEVRRETSDLDHDGRGQGEDERFEPPAGRLPRLVLTTQDELLPQSAAVLAREFPGQGVESAHPFHGDEERLIVREPGCVQLGDLVPEMSLELSDIRAVDGRSLRDVGPPLGNLGLHPGHGHASPSANGGSRAGPRQTSPNARVTATHCRCCSRSAARPSSVIA